MKRIQFFIQELAGTIEAIVFLKRQAFKMRLAIYLADLRQKAFNKRYFVVLCTVGVRKDGSVIDRLRSICNSDFKECKRRGWLPKKMGYVELSEKSFYQTKLSRNNSEKKEAREKAKRRYLNYMRVMKG